MPSSAFASDSSLAFHLVYNISDIFRLWLVSACVRADVRGERATSDSDRSLLTLEPHRAASPHRKHGLRRHRASQRRRSRLLGIITPTLRHADPRTQRCPPAQTRRTTTQRNSRRRRPVAALPTTRCLPEPGLPTQELVRNRTETRDTGTCTSDAVPGSQQYLFGDPAHEGLRPLVTLSVRIAGGLAAYGAGCAGAAQSAKTCRHRRNARRRPRAGRSALARSAACRGACGCPGGRAREEGQAAVAEVMIPGPGGRRLTLLCQMGRVRGPGWWSSMTRWG